MIKLSGVFFNKSYTLDAFKPGVENFGVILKGKSIEKLHNISDEFNDCFIVNNFDKEIAILGDCFLNKNIVHLANRMHTASLTPENYKKLNIKEIQLIKSGVWGDRGLLKAANHYQSLGLKTVFLPKNFLNISSNLFGSGFAKKFANTGLLAIYYALKIIKPKNLWIIGLEFYQIDYLERRPYHPPIEVLQDKMKRVNAVGVMQKWIEEYSNVNFNMLTYFDGFKLQPNLRLL